MNCSFRIPIPCTYNQNRYSLLSEAVREKSSQLSCVVHVYSKLTKGVLWLYLFYFEGDVEERVLDRMSNLSHKYKSVKKDKAGSMLNHTQRTLRDYFREPMKRLASLLHDKKYTWDDVYTSN